MFYWIKKLILKERASSTDYIKYLRKKGVEIGSDVEIYRPFNTTIDICNPHLLVIGNHVMITGPATILAHDYSWCVLKRKYGNIVGNQRKTVIGSNVFIGWGATILGGSRIGDNVIIGANSVVSGYVEPDSVYAGNPAKKIMGLDEYLKKRQKKQLEEAVDYVYEFNRVFGGNPKEEDLYEYFFLWTSDSSNLHDKFRFQMQLMCNEEESYKVMNEHKPYFNNYEEFLRFCQKDRCQ